MSYPTFDVTPETEAYQKNGVVLVVHRREGGEVFYHVQAPEDTFVGFDKFRRIDEAFFDSQVTQEGVTRFELPTT